MILFINKKTGQTIGTIDGRMHDPQQLEMTIKSDDMLDSDVVRLVIGWEDPPKGKPIEHNMHLWKHLLEFEDHNNPKTALNQEVIFDKKGNPTGFKPKSPK